MQIERIVAPNPGPMTLTGTNTYLVADGSGRVLAIDPGPEDASHLSAVLAGIEQLGHLTLVLVTHRHLDHLPAAVPLCRETGARFIGHRDLPGVQRPVSDGETVFDDLVALETPGHTRDSLCLWSPSAGVLFTGDLVLGTGTAVLDEASGALRDYMASLERLRALAPRTIYPGHGPIVQDASAKLTEYAEHRQQRLEQVERALRERGASTPEQLTAALYVDTPPNLWPMAARNVRATLELLLGERRVEQLEGDRWQLIA